MRNIVEGTLTWEPEDLLLFFYCETLDMCPDSWFLTLLLFVFRNLFSKAIGGGWCYWKPELPWDVPTRTLFQPIIMNMRSTNYWCPSYAHIHILGTHKCRKKLCRSVEVLGRFISVKLYGWPWCDHGSLRSLQEKKAGNKNPDLEWC